MAYLVDYEVNSSSIEGTKTKGSVYLRGIKSEGEGVFDSFKFILEKAVDFNELDIKLFVKAFEEAFMPKLKVS